jgi:hypothetical protein
MAIRSRKNVRSGRNHADPDAGGLQRKMNMLTGFESSMVRRRLRVACLQFGEEVQAEDYE